MTLKQLPKTGDKVKIKTKDKLLVGILMERPKLADDKYLTIKLESGYNVGIKKNEIKEIEIKGDNKELKRGRIYPTVKEDPDKPTVTIISTGGTIASRIDYHTGGVYASFTAKDLVESYPELATLANIKTCELMNVMSEDMNPQLWMKIAQAVYTELISPQVTGVVVTHGTDTLSYTSAALSFMLQNLAKPVALTGSQRSSDRGSADSFLNLICSVIWATSKYKGVSTIMHGSISDEFCLAHPGTRVRKMHTTKRDAFQSINAKPWAKIYPNGKIITKNVTTGDLSVVSPSPLQKIELVSKLEEKVAFIKIYPGMDPQLIDFYLKKNVKGIVFEGTALGHVPTDIKGKSLLPQIEKAKELGVVMAMTSQCLSGRVNPYVYSNLREISSKGVIYCEDMLPGTAYVKLMWILGQTKDKNKAREMMLKNYAGEISARSKIDNVVPNFK